MKMYHALWRRHGVSIPFARLTLFLTLLLFLIATSPRLQAQNLVLNPSFENSTGCPNNYGQFNLVTNWTSPTIGTPDYFKSCPNTPPCTAGVPSNAEGNREPHHGIAYAGIFNQTSPNVSPWREYIKAELDVALLKPDTWYKVSFWASLSDHNSAGFEHLGFYVGNGCVTQPNRHLVYPVLPTHTHPTAIATTEWTQVVGYYYSLNGDEDCLIIGLWDPQLITKPAPGLPLPCSWPAHFPSTEVYYYIDDVSMTEEPTPRNCDCNSQAYQISIDEADPGPNGECCWSVNLTTAYNACPLYQVDIRLPGAASPAFTWESATPLRPQTTTSLGTMCIRDFHGPKTVTIDFYNTPDDIKCSAQKEISCECSCDGLIVRTVSEIEAREDNFCCFSIRIENPTGCSIPLSEIGYTMQGGGTFVSADDGAWTKVNASSGSTIRWKAQTTNNLIPPHSSTTVGYFCIDETLDRRYIDVVLYKNQYGESPELSCTRTTSAYCTGFDESCCDKLLFFLTQEFLDVNVPDPDHWHMHLFQNGEDIPCEIGTIQVVKNNSKDVHHVSQWNYNERLPLPPSRVWGPIPHYDLGQVTITPGFDPSELLLFIYDVNGNLICIKQGTDSWFKPALKRTQFDAHPESSPELFPHSEKGAPTLTLAPNPTTDDVTITIGFPVKGAVTLELFNIHGSLIERIFHGDMSGRSHSLVYSTSKLPSGNYRVRLSYPGHTAMSTLTVTH